VINELRRIFKDQPFDVIDAAVPQARYKHGTLKWVPIKEALQGLVGSGLVKTETGHFRCTGGTGQ
jgi:hypothetical protein